jgi:hypothetical protein
MKTICLLKDDVNLIANGAQAWVAGWGVTEQGRKSSIFDVQNFANVILI